MVGRALCSESSMGTALGVSGCDLAICSPSWPSAGIDWSGSRGNRSLEGLATSGLCSDPLCGNRGDRRICASADDHETNIEGAGLGVNLNANSIWIHVAVLGSPAGAAFAGGDFRISIQDQRADSVNVLDRNFDLLMTMVRVLGLVTRAIISGCPR
ncbi:MAG: hypothetical protein JWO91_1279 [Acidobacteriaceae bacterium]|nr:hypothetical protein [Acidobacteriaceae bacterium]